MKFGTTARPEQVEAMVRVLDNYCEQAGILNASDREEMAVKIVALYEIGVTSENELLHALILPVHADSST